MNRAHSPRRRPLDWGTTFPTSDCTGFVVAQGDHSAQRSAFKPLHVSRRRRGTSEDHNLGLLACFKKSGPGLYRGSASGQNIKADDLQLTEFGASHRPFLGHCSYGIGRRGNERVVSTIDFYLHRGIPTFRVHEAAPVTVAKHRHYGPAIAKLLKIREDGGVIVPAVALEASPADSARSAQGERSQEGAALARGSHWASMAAPLAPALDSLVAARWGALVRSDRASGSPSRHSKLARGNRWNREIVPGRGAL